MNKRNHPTQGDHTPDTLNQLDLLELPGVSGFDLEQPQPAALQADIAPTPDTTLSALESDGWYVLPILARQWGKATTRNDWKHLQEWLEVLSVNASMYKTRPLLDEYNLLLSIAKHHRKESARKARQEHADMLEDFADAEQNITLRKGEKP